MIINRKSLDGVARKILAQCRALGSYNKEDKIYLASFFENEKYLIIGNNYEKELIFEHNNSRQVMLFSIYPQLKQITKDLQINAVYFRIFALSWVTEDLFKGLREQDVTIITEIPTYPFWKEKWKDVRNKLADKKIGTAVKRTVTNIVYYVYAKRMHKYVRAIVTFSDIKRLWNIPVIGIANGYDFKELGERMPLKQPNEKLNLLIVASIRRNHGIDRIIQGMIDYYQNGGERDIYFHIVGEGEAVPELKQIASSPFVSERVIFHGFKSGKELEDIYSEADIGVSALGFHRLGVYYASPLKSKEYFAKGKPVIGTTVEHDVISSATSRYYLAFPEDDSPINISKMLQFYDHLRESGCTNQDIEQCAAGCFSWFNIMKPIYKEMGAEK